MTLLDSLAARFGYSKARANTKAPAWALESASNAQYTLPDMYSVFAQEDVYRKLSWVQIAVHMVASSCAGVPLGVYKRDGEGKTAIENHPLEMLLQSPNELDSDREEFAEASFAYYLLTGNGYWWVNASSPTAPPDELWIVPPEKIQPIPDGKQYIRAYQYTDGAYRVEIPVTDIIHFKSFHPTSRFVGLSPIGALSATVTGDLAMSKWNAKFFDKDNAKPPGALMFANFPNETDWEKLKADLRNEHGGTSRNFAMMRGISKDAVNYMNFGIPQKDMEFLLGRQFNREEIFQLYGVPMGLVSENATEANATVADIGFNKRTLWPLLTRFAGKITSRLLPRYGDGLIAEYDDIRVTDRQLELEERRVWSLYRKVDELRQADDLEPIGDERGAKLVAQITPDDATQPTKDGAPESVAGRQTTGDAAPDNLSSVQGLNGAQITAALQVVADTQAGSTPIEVARELFAALGIAPDRVDRMVGSLKPGSQPKPEVKPAISTVEKPDDMGKQMVDDDEMPVNVKALRLWRKKSLRMYAVKGTGVCGFEADGIPVDVRNRVAYGLARAGDTGAIKAVFDGEIQAVEGKHSAEVVELATAIRRAGDLIREGIE